MNFFEKHSSFNKPSLICIATISTTTILSIITYKYFNEISNFYQRINTTEDNKSSDNKSSDNETEDNETEDNETEDNKSSDNKSSDNKSEDNETEDNKSEDSAKCSQEVVTTFEDRATVHENVSNILKDVLVSNNLITNIDNVSKVHSLLIGCNYKGTPYAVSNCIKNTTNILDLISSYKYEKLQFTTPSIISEDANSSKTILNKLQSVYSECNDNDCIFIYYSGYCDKDHETNNDILTLGCDPDKNNSLEISSMCKIVTNPKIRLIIIIDGYYYDTLKQHSNYKSNHLIIGSFVDDQTNQIKETTFTENLCKIIKTNTNFDFNHPLWKKVQIIGDKNLLKW